MIRPIAYDHDHDHDGDHDHDHPCDTGASCGAARIPWRTVGLLALIALMGGVLWRTIFFVDQTEYVYVTEFGKPLRLHTEPGLRVKWPYQSLWRFDRMLQLYEPPAREMLTEDKENLIVDWYVCWRIPGPEFDPAGTGNFGGEQAIEKYVDRFLQSVGTVPAAENRLEERIQATLAAEIGRARLAQLVSLDVGSLQLEPIMTRVTDSIRTSAAEQFGIEVVDVRLKRFNYPEAVKPAVFAEIRSEREKVAVQYRAEGASQKTKIESLANLQRDQLLAQAKREATKIRGEGEAKAIETLNAAHGKNPEFYELLKTLETYRSILDEQTTVVLSADSPLLKLLTKGLPSLVNPAVPTNTKPSNQKVPAVTTTVPATPEPSP